MNILKREVLARTDADHVRDSIRFFDRFCVIGLAIGVIWAVSMTIGIRIGRDAARHETLMGSDPVTVEAGACGIADPVACAVQVMESVADLFRSAPDVVVTATPTTVVVCAEAEQAYWACVNDATCPLETFETIADDVNFCQTRR